MKTPTDPNRPDATATKKPYEAPRVEKKRSVARVTLLTGMGVMGVGVVAMMN